MIKSMTGYGKSIIDNNEVCIELEIKSLNSKSLDLRIKTKQNLGSREIDIQNIISKNLIRGKVDCTIKIDQKQKQGGSKINENVFEKYYEKLRDMSNKYIKNAGQIDYFDIIMKLPDVVEIEDTNIDESWDLLSECLNLSCKKLDDFRIQEGKALEADLIKSISIIEKSLEKVKDFESERLETIKTKILSGFEELKLKIDNERLESEMIYYIEKFDINEEKSRLKNHIKYFTETIEEENCGKKLGFIAQEMGREINTLGSKANHFEIQKLVVTMKDELEKIKEQVLNIL